MKRVFSRKATEIEYKLFIINALWILDNGLNSGFAGRYTHGILMYRIYNCTFMYIYTGIKYINNATDICYKH